MLYLKFVHLGLTYICFHTQAIMYRTKTIILFLGFFLAGITSSTQIILNEVCHANLNVLADEDGDYEDWIELVNNGASTIDLSGYALSDDPQEPQKWPLLAGALAPGETKLIWCSGKDRQPIVNHFEVPVFAADEWRYIIPLMPITNNWKFPGFAANGWSEGPGGIGYGDGDDATIVPVCTSVYMRRAFQLEEAQEIMSALFFIDYDDGFVAYLNGIEIARENLGAPGTAVAYNQLADIDREAQVIQGGTFTFYNVDQDFLNGVLVDGENVLAIEIHNVTAGSSDLSCIPYLVLGSASETVQFPLAPEDWNLTISNTYHTNFKLTTNEVLNLYNPGGIVIDSYLITQTAVDHSAARSNGVWCFTANPTPAEMNPNECSGVYEPKPEMNVGAGVYSGAVSVVLTVPSSTAIIRYTLDGSIPTMEDPVYVAPLFLNETAVLSARSFSTIGNLPSQVTKNTYLINELGIGNKYISISTNEENLWDEQIGIYVLGPPDYEPYYPYFGSNWWEDWERQSYIEFFDGNELRFEGEMGLKIHGGWSRAQDQKSFRIRLRDEYGLSEANYPIIPDKEGIQSYSSFNLRNAGNDYWGARMRDSFMQRVVRDTHNDYMATSTAVVFLNGEYWGHYEIRENLDEDWCESNHGTDADMIDLITDTYMGFDVKEGSDVDFWQMHDLIVNGDPNSDDFFELANERLDLENFADYIITETYYANCDWSCGYTNNTKFWHYQGETGKWRYMLMDLDFGLGLYGESPDVDFITRARDEDFAMDRICNRLLQNDEFKHYFINRYADLINTVWQQSNMIEVGNAMRDEMAPIIERHHQRWGGDYWSWYNGLEAMLGWNEQRINGGRNQVQSHFGLAGQIDITLDVVPAGAGRIHISTIEPEETNYPWTGVYYMGVPLRITAIANPGYIFQYFGANGVFDENMPVGSFVLNLFNDEQFTAYFIGQPENIVPQLAEVMYHPDFSQSTGDWIELINPSSQTPLDVSSWIIQDEAFYNRFIIPVNTIIPAGGRLVIAENEEIFSNHYPEVNNVVGSTDFGFGNAGDEIKLYNAHDELMWSMQYDDALPWPLGTDGWGRSLERVSISNDANAPDSWFAGCVGGSPGEAYFACVNDIVVSEINYNSSSLADAGDWLELWNTSSETIDLSGMILRDGSDNNSFVIPQGTLLNPDERRVFVFDAALFVSRFQGITEWTAVEGFGLSSLDAIRIYSSDNSLLQSVAYAGILPWPTGANGNGRTLELADVNGWMTDASNWFDGCPEGSPTIAYDPACGSVGVTENSSGVQWWIGPQPADEYFMVQSQDDLLELIIYDVHGKIIQEKVISSGIHRIDIRDLAQGMYVIAANNSAYKPIKLIVN